jgi:signal transduction histidine kinase
MVTAVQSIPISIAMRMSSEWVLGAELLFQERRGIGDHLVRDVEGTGYFDNLVSPRQKPQYFEFTRRRANVIAMVDNGALDQNKSDSRAQKVLQSVEALQSTNRRILDRLRPMYIEGLGLQSSIQRLLRSVRS